LTGPVDVVRRSALLLLPLPLLVLSLALFACRRLAVLLPLVKQSGRCDEQDSEKSIGVRERQDDDDAKYLPRLRSCLSASSLFRRGQT
jgi:hypothetical protein